MSRGYSSGSDHHGADAASARVDHPSAGIRKRPDPSSPRRLRSAAQTGPDPMIPTSDTGRSDDIPPANHRTIEARKTRCDHIADKRTLPRSRVFRLSAVWESAAEARTLPGIADRPSGAMGPGRGRALAGDSAGLESASDRTDRLGHPGRAPSRSTDTSRGPHSPVRERSISNPWALLRRQRWAPPRPL